MLSESVVVTEIRFQEGIVREVLITMVVFKDYLLYQI